MEKLHGHKTSMGITVDFICFYSSLYHFFIKLSLLFLSLQLLILFQFIIPIRSFYFLLYRPEFALMKRRNHPPPRRCDPLGSTQMSFGVPIWPVPISPKICAPKNKIQSPISSVFLCYKHFQIESFI